MLLQLVDFRDVFSGKISVFKNAGFFGKVSGSLFVGPIVSKEFCVKCFQKRIFSSSFFDIQQFISPTKGDIAKVKKILSKKPFPVTHGIILEYRKGAIFSKHNLLKVPTCKCLGRNL